MNTVSNFGWAGRALRLDPFRLPQVTSYAAGDECGEVTVTLDRRGAVMRRMLERSGLPVSILLPARTFRGVAARAMEEGDGSVTVTLELLHPDPKLCVPLLVAYDLDDVAADWRAWAEAYRLPMLLIEADGVARSLEESLTSAGRSRAIERRKRASSQPRRPRFLMRRKKGTLGLRLVVKGEEIIARS